MAAHSPGSMNFDPDEIQRIEDAQLILLGVSFSDLGRMSLQQRYDLMEIARAQNDPKKYLFGT